MKALRKVPIVLLAITLAGFASKAKCQTPAETPKRQVRLVPSGLPAGAETYHGAMWLATAEILVPWLTDTNILIKGDLTVTLMPDEKDVRKFLLEIREDDSRNSYPIELKLKGKKAAEAAKNAVEAVKNLLQLAQPRAALRPAAEQNLKRPPPPRVGGLDLFYSLHSYTTV